ncbi:MAG: PIN domain nuclease [Andreesenia angusta]|nr:PIN domain nuclease [Andreesenia angusta]
MIKKLGAILITLIGAGIGLGIVGTLDTLLLFEGKVPSDKIIYIYIFSGIIFGLIFLILSKKISLLLKKLFNEVEDEMQKIPVSDIILGFFGLIMGLIIAYLLGTALSEIPIFGVVLMVLLYIILGYVGMRVMVKKKNDVIRIFDKFKRNRVDDKKDLEDEKKTRIIKPKILDTSVIIDGRIYEVCKADFLEGSLIIPEFVLKELQNISDSSDDLKRVRGRRGLDILQKIQKELDMDIVITEKDYENVKEVDLKLLKLAQEIGGKVVTTDFNLNKVAEVHGVPVLNMNELSNALKPMAIPGDNILVNVVKKGKEANQGVAYLDDGTMIVIEDGKDFVGKEVDLLVTSVLQTPAGRMIFGKPKKLKLLE